MSVAEEVLKRLTRPPAAGGPPTPEAARGEAAVRAKRADATYSAQGAQGVGAALDLYEEALEIDPNCKAAYEGIAKIVLGKAATEPAAIEAALRYVDVAEKRLPSDTGIREVKKRLRSLLPSEAKPTDSGIRPGGAKKPSRSSGRSGAPARRCETCGSPIPAGAAACRSCDLAFDSPLAKKPAAPPQGLFGRIFSKLLGRG